MLPNNKQTNNRIKVNVCVYRDVCVCACALHRVGQRARGHHIVSSATHAGHKPAISTTLIWDQIRKYSGRYSAEAKTTAAIWLV